MWRHPPTELLVSAGTVCWSRQAFRCRGAVSDRPDSTKDHTDTVVRTEIGGISTRAVYDPLGTLNDKGIIIRRLQPTGRPSLYEHRIGDNLQHLIYA
jgi:Fur family transcriptional regulator, stress-responsive regulator